MRHFPFHGQDTVTPKLAQVSMRTPSAPVPYFFLTPTTPIGTLPPATVLYEGPAPVEQPGLLVPLLAAAGIAAIAIAVLN